MANISYLWNNRVRFSMSSVAFYKTWAKRILTFKELFARNRRKRTLIKKGAEISATAEIGNIIADGNKKNLNVGSFSFLGRVTVALHDKVVIGNFVCINDGVQLLTASHDVSDPEWKSKKSPIVIEDYAWVATNAIILPGVQIGKGAVVGAGAVVSKNVQPYEIVTGNPAKPITKKRCTNLEYNPCEFLAANRAWLIG